MKSCVFIFTCLNFSHLKSTLHLMRYTSWDVFSTVQNSFGTHTFWCLLVLLPFFLFHLFHISKTFPFEDFFTQGNTKKVTLSKISWIGWVGHGGHAVFGQKLLNTQRGVGRCACKSPIMKWANCWKSLQKKFHWSQTQPLTTMPTGTLIQMGS